MPEPDGDLLVEMVVEGHQDEPWTRRICRDGAVWTHSNLRTWIEDGEVRQERRPPQWERVTTAPPEALERIEQIMREHDLLHAPPVQRPTGTVTGVGITTWRLALDGEEHEIRLEHLPLERAPALAELRQAMELGVAMGLDAESAS